VSYAYCLPGLPRRLAQGRYRGGTEGARNSVAWLNQGGPEIENGEAVAAILEPMRPWPGEQGRSCLSPKAQRDWSPVPKFDVAVAIADLRERENTARATMR
jgi:hypothetical protein